MSWTWSRGPRSQQDEWFCYKSGCASNREEPPQSAGQAENEAIEHAKETGHPVKVSHESWYDILPGLPVEWPLQADIPPDRI